MKQKFHIEIEICQTSKLYLLNGVVQNSPNTDLFSSKVVWHLSAQIVVHSFLIGRDSQRAI